MLKKLFSTIKALFFVFIIIQFVPAIIVSTKHLFNTAMHSKTHIALLPVNGMISDAAFYTNRLDAFLKDDDIKGLILRINSPGGISGCCQAIFNEISNFAKKKPVVAVVENVAASGSYYIAAAADCVIVSPLSLIGSIGVYMELANAKQLLADWHVDFTYVQTGKYKTVGSKVKDLSSDDTAYLQKLSDDQYNCFVREIAKARGLDPSQHTLWADGQIFTGVHALELKLVDQLGSISDAIEEMKKLASIDADQQIKLVQAPKHTGLLRQLLLGNSEDGDGEGFDLASSLATFASKVSKQFCAEQAMASVQTNL